MCRLVPFQRTCLFTLPNHTSQTKKEKKKNLSFLSLVDLLYLPGVEEKDNQQIKRCATLNGKKFLCAPVFDDGPKKRDIFFFLVYPFFSLFPEEKSGASSLDYAVPHSGSFSSFASHLLSADLSQ